MRSIRITIYADVPASAANDDIANSIEFVVLQRLVGLGGSLEGFAVHPAVDSPPGGPRHGGSPPGATGAGTRRT